jgi:hypothetical protein
MLLYRDFNQDGTGDVNTPKVIGLGGWQQFKHLFSGGNGTIYAVDSFARKPNAPTGLKVTEVTDRKISVSWADQSDNENGFSIQFLGKRASLSDHAGSKSVAANVTSTSLTGLRSNFEYAINAVAFNADGESPKSNEVRATTPARTISVTKEGTGSSTVLTVKGSGFTPSSLVVIKITDAQLQQVQFPETAGTDGKFVSKHSVSCVSSAQLTITAFEDADPLGTFANAIVTTCP